MNNQTLSTMAWTIGAVLVFFSFAIPRLGQSPSPSPDHLPAAEPDPVVFETAPSIVDTPIPDNTQAGLRETIEVDSDAIQTIESISVRVECPSHPWNSDLSVTLHAPWGDSFSLAIAEPSSAPKPMNYSLEGPFPGAIKGPWTLEVSDGSPQDAGNLKEWQITFKGRPDRGALSRENHSKKPN